MYVNSKDFKKKQFFKQFLREVVRGLGMVAHACNPSYSEGRDQEDCNSKPS
jgi:hypothetical protein